ncbi:hypothetical protein JXB02_02600 [Candidatus Woesearchaeota archaeon]|nr:hypothetical protein [Candidatus Woesearchaeota archaeon]
MNETIKADLIRIWAKVLEIINTPDPNDIFELRDISNFTIHNASIYQDKDSTSAAILVYALSKLADRKISFGKEFTRPITRFTDLLKKDDLIGYRKRVIALFKHVESIDARLRYYIDEVVRLAQIKKGSKLYDHGISLAQSSEVLGISQWDLMDYIGATTVGEPDSRENVGARLRFTRDLFGISGRGARR